MAAPGYGSTYCIFALSTACLTAAPACRLRLPHTFLDTNTMTPTDSVYARPHLPAWQPGSSGTEVPSLLYRLRLPHILLTRTRTPPRSLPTHGATTKAPQQHEQTPRLCWRISAHSLSARVLHSFFVNACLVYAPHRTLRPPAVYNALLTTWRLTTRALNHPTSSVIHTFICSAISLCMT